MLVNHLRSIFLGKKPRSKKQRKGDKPFPFLLISLFFIGIATPSALVADVCAAIPIGIASTRGAWNHILSVVVARVIFHDVHCVNV